MSKMGNYVVGLQEAVATRVDCPECGGEGKCTYEKFVPAGFNKDYGEWEDYVTQCDNCRGCGKVDIDAETKEDIDRETKE